MRNIRPTFGRWSHLGLGMLVLAGFAGWAISQAPPRADETSTVQGKIRRFTTAPKGEVDGAVLDNGTVIHWPPHLGDRVQNLVNPGDAVRAVGRDETGPAGDQHFEVQSLINLRNQAKLDLGAAAPPPPPAAPPVPRFQPARPDANAGQAGTMQGRVRSFTTAPRGEVDGAVLDDGTVIHWPPHLGNRVRNQINAGDRIRVTGQNETGPAGDVHFEAQSITNLRSNAQIDFGANVPAPPPPKGR